MFLDPFDPQVIREAERSGIPRDWIDAAQRSPVYKLFKKWELALPLHPEFRTLPMLFYIPPLAPIVTSAGNHSPGDTDVFDMAKASGLDMARLKRDMNGADVSDQIISVFNQARGIRVFQTPAYIVGGNRGAHILGSESAAIDFAREVAAARR